MQDNNFTYNDDNIKSLVRSHYHYYLKLFSETINYINSKEIFRKRFPDIYGYDYAYFHMISKDYKNNQECDCQNPFIICEHPFIFNPLIDKNNPREICPIRVKATNALPGFFDRSLKIWSKKISRGGLKERICCYDQENDYLIVLEARKNGDIYFVTGYPIEYKFRRNKLLKEYEKSKNNGIHFFTNSKPKT